MYMSLTEGSFTGLSNNRAKHVARLRIVLINSDLSCQLLFNPSQQHIRPKNKVVYPPID